MNLCRKRNLSFLLALVLVLSCILPGAVPVKAVAYENTYVNTGNQRADIIGVALTQVGYSEGKNNDTKYGTWYGMPNQPWCAMFVSWCAEVADVPADVLTRTARAHPGYFELSYKSGSSYTPQPGDLFFSKSFSHVGFVYYVEGNYFYTIEGNSNNNGSTEGTGVFINKRLISSFYFSSPAYKGCDKAHTYVTGSDSAHPHKTYYQCSTCGEKHYTGKTAFSDSCKTCTACGCNASYAGTYVCITTDTTLRIRSGHGTSYSTVGYIPSGGKVYVHAASGPKGWAHIQYEAYQGYVSMEYLLPVPKAPTVSVSAGTFYKGDTASISWKKADYAESYQLKMEKDGTQLLSKNVGTDLRYTLSGLQPGSYTVQVSAVNKAGVSEAGTAAFTVLDTYTVTYALRDGTDGPSAQVKNQGVDLMLSDTVPSREGYTFLGWTADAQSSFVSYRPGDTLTEDTDITLYAVWKADDAVPQTLAIGTMPVRTMFVLDEELDTTGLVLSLTYSDGSGEPISENFAVSEISAQEIGAETVTVTLEGLSVTYDVQIVEYIPGDFNEDRFVTEDDAMYLLRHVLFAEKYPVTIPGDLTANAQVNEDDAMYLLRHVLFPELYPLQDN